MIDDKTVHRLLDYVAYEVLRRMVDGKTLEQIDDDLIRFLRKADRIAVFERMVEVDEDGNAIAARKEADAVVAHLRTLKH